MKSTILKLTALAGVMGAGFLAVYHAQTKLVSTATGEETAQSGDEFHDLDSESSAGTETASPSGPDAKSPQSLDPETPPPQQQEPEPPAQSEPTPAFEPEKIADSANPFYEFSRPPTSAPSEPSADDDQTAEDVNQASPDDEDGLNPFADFGNDLADSAGSNEPISESSTETRTPHAVMPQNFASNDQQNEPTVAPAETFDPFAADIADAPRRASATQAGSTELESSVNPFDTQASSNEEATASPNLAATPLQPDQNGLHPEQDGPSLVAPPSDTATVDQVEQDVSAPEAEKGQAPGLANLSNDQPILPQQVDSDKVAQTSNEQPSADSGDSNPFLTFPGESSPSPDSSQRDSLQRSPSESTFEPNEESPGDTSPTLSSARSPESAPPSDEAGQVQDESVEVTIQPRSDDSPNPIATEAPSPRAAPPLLPEQGESVEADPFGGTDATKQRPMPPGVQPSPLPGGQAAELRPVRENTGPTLHSPERDHRIEPNPANVEPARGNAEHQPQLRPESLLGVGTIESDSPLGTHQAQVTIEKEAPPDAVIGKPLIYSIHIRNIGRSVAENVIVRDVTPKGSRLVGTAPQAELDEVNNQLVWRMGKMASGESRTVKIKVVPTDAGQIGSVATVSFEAAVAARTVITAPQLKLSIHGPDEVRVGEKVTYRFTLTNAGSADAHGVFIRNLIPEGFEHPHGNDLEYQVGVLPQGQSRNVSLTMAAVQPGRYDCRAILRAEGDVSIDSVHNVSVLKPRLTIRRQGPADRFVGRPAEFTNTINNDSDDLLQNITIVETVPVGIEFEAASDGGKYDPQERTVTWNLRQLPPRGQRQVQARFVPKQAETHTSTIRAFDPHGNSAEVASRLNVAGFSSLKAEVVHDGTPVPVGEQVAIRLTIKNRGTAPASGVKTLVEIPPQMRFVDAKGPVSSQLIGGNLIEFETLNTLEIGGQQQFDIVLTAAEKGNACVRVELQSDELTRPLNQEELVVIHPNQD